MEGKFVKKKKKVVLFFFFLASVRAVSNASEELLSLQQGHGEILAMFLLIYYRHPNAESRNNIQSKDFSMCSRKQLVILFNWN